MIPETSIPQFLSVEYDSRNPAFRFIFNKRLGNEIGRLVRPYFQTLRSIPEELIFQDSEGASICTTNPLFLKTPGELRYELPAFYVNREPCTECNKTGFKDDMTCLACHGTGIRRDKDERAVESFHVFGKTLHIISEALQTMMYSFDRPGLSSPVIASMAEQQTMTFRLDSTGGYDSDMTGWLRDEVIAATKSFSEEETMAVREAMRSVRERLFGHRPELKIHEFRFYHSKHFELQIPGSHSALILGDKEPSWSCGRTLYCHNVDGRSSQILLLAGLATIDRLARETFS